MSEFTPKFVANYEKAYQKAQHELQMAQRLLAALPDNYKEPVSAGCFGYCADMNVVYDFSGLDSSQKSQRIQEMLKAFPPLPIVDLPTVRAQKPVSYLRDNEVEAYQRELYPVLFKSSNVRRADGQVSLGDFQARWWTQLPLGVVEVVVKDVTTADVTPGPAYGADTHSYMTGAQSMYKREFARYPIGNVAPMEDVFKPLEDFIGKQKKPQVIALARAVKERLLRGAERPVVDEHSLLTAGHQAWYRMEPHRYFDEATAKELVAATREVEAKLPETNALIAVVTEVLDQGVAMVQRELGGFSSMAQNDEESLYLSAALQQRLSREIGRGLKVKWLKFDYRKNIFDVRLVVHDDNVTKTRAVQDAAFRDIVVPANPNGLAMNWQSFAAEMTPLPQDAHAAA